MNVLALEFPSIGHLLVWPGILFDDTVFELNKVGLIYVFATVATLSMFFVSARRAALVPRGVQQLTEGGVEFVRESIINQTMGPGGYKFRDFLRVGTPLAIITALVAAGIIPRLWPF